LFGGSGLVKPLHFGEQRLSGKSVLAKMK